MARSMDPNSANSQFFICFDAAPHLDGQYTVFGKVIQGMEFVDKIKKGDGPNGTVSNPDKILDITFGISNAPDTYLIFKFLYPFFFNSWIHPLIKFSEISL